MFRLIRRVADAMGALVEPWPAELGGSGNGSVAGRTSYEAMIIEMLRQNEAVGLAALVDWVADEMMRAEQIRGGWVSDIGVWGPALFRREAIDTIRRMLGRTLVLE